jgi:predicted porin
VVTRSSPAVRFLVIACALAQPLAAQNLTLYGVVDLGIQYETHGVPPNDYYIGGTAAFLRPNDRGPVLAVTPNNLGQSLIGLEGNETFGDRLTLAFKLETYFNPQSGELSSGFKSLAQNNGRALDQQGTALDSSVDGEPLETAYLAISSCKLGSLQVGRITTPLADGVAKYDPGMVSNAFSLIGAQGTAAGGGDTEERRLSSLAKWEFEGSGLRVAAAGKSGGWGARPRSIVQLSLGTDVGPLFLDAYYARVKGAVAVSLLTRQQVASLPALGDSADTALAGTASDNLAYALMGKYRSASTEFYGGLEWIRYENPDGPIPAGIDDVGYILAFMNNAAYDHEHLFRILWTGIRQPLRSNLYLTFGYYGYWQGSYATGMDAGCADRRSSACRGTETALTVATVLQLSPDFDAYMGAMYTTLHDGLASGYLHTATLASTLGLRFRFGLSR